MAKEVSHELETLLQGMQQGQEQHHLQHMVRLADHRGADVQLWSQEVLGAIRQRCPYPAFKWAWKSTQAYPWTSDGDVHINILGVLAFFNFLLHETESTRFTSKRFLHVFDSQVAAAVTAKGRSSSIQLNKILLRVSGVVLAADLYPLAVWTLSHWNFSDVPSRAFEPWGK